MHPKRGSSSDQLPSVVYLALIGFVSWMALAAWGFAGPGYADVALTVVTGFLVIVIAIPLILWRVWRANHERPDAPEDRAKFSDWAAGEFETWQDSVKGTNAAARDPAADRGGRRRDDGVRDRIPLSAQHASG